MFLPKLLQVGKEKKRWIFNVYYTKIEILTLRQ